MKINGKQTVKLKSGSIKFKNHFKQLAASFKVYGDFEYILENNNVNNRYKNTSYTEKDQDHTHCSFAYKTACIDDKFSKPILLYRRENAVYSFIDAIL